MFLSFRVVVRTWDCLCRVEALLQQKLLGALEPDSTYATATCAFPVKSHIWRKVAALVWDRCLLLLRQPLGAGLVDADIFVSRIQGGLRERERGKRERQVLHLVHLESGWQRSTPPPAPQGFRFNPCRLLAVQLRHGQPSLLFNSAAGHAKCR